MFSITQNSLLFLSPPSLLLPLHFFIFPPFFSLFHFFVHFFLFLLHSSPPLPSSSSSLSPSPALQELGIAVSQLAQRTGRHMGGLFCNPAGHTTPGIGEGERVAGGIDETQGGEEEVGLNRRILLPPNVYLRCIPPSAR